MIDIRWILVAFVAAVGIFSFYTYYHRSVLGVLVRALLESGATSPETAKNLAEMDVAPRAAYSRALSGASALSRVVTVVGKREKLPVADLSASDESLNLLRFYIAPESQAKARGIYGTAENIVAPVVITAASLVLALVLWAVLPAAFPALF